MYSVTHDSDTFVLANSVICDLTWLTAAYNNALHNARSQ